MMLFVRLLLIVFGGVAAHMTKPLIERYFKPPYSRLVEYGIGVLAVQPAVVILDEQLAEIRNCRERHLLSNLLAFVLFGGGVLIGYLVDLVGKD